MRQGNPRRNSGGRTLDGRLSAGAHAVLDLGRSSDRSLRTCIPCGGTWRIPVAVPPCSARRSGEDPLLKNRFVGILARPRRSLSCNGACFCQALGFASAISSSYPFCSVGGALLVLYLGTMAPPFCTVLDRMLLGTLKCFPPSIPFVLSDGIVVPPVRLTPMLCLRLVPGLFSGLRGPFPVSVFSYGRSSSPSSRALA